VRASFPLVCSNSIKYGGIGENNGIQRSLKCHREGGYINRLGSLSLGAALLISWGCPFGFCAHPKIQAWPIGFDPAYDHCSLYIQEMGHN